MIVHKIFAFLLVIGLIIQANAFAATAQNVKNGELTPELKQNALKLLSAVAREAQQFNLPENRVRARTIVADLLWEHDEQAARTVFQHALGELQNLLAGVNLPEDKVLTSSERGEQYARRYKLADLRRDLILSLAIRDAATAVKALGALKVKKFEDGDPLDAGELELQVAAEIAKKDADKAYALVKARFAAEGATHRFIQSLKDLHGRDSKLAARAARDVLARIKNSKIRSESGGENESEEAAETNRTEKTVSFWQAALFVNTASELNRRAARDKEKKTLPLLAENEMKELVNFIAAAFLTAPDWKNFGISQVMPEIIEHAPAQAQRIRQKVGAKGSQQIDNTLESSAFYTALGEKNAEEMAKFAETAAPEKRDTYYAEAVSKALDEKEPEKAQAFAARIKDRKNYAYLFERIETALPLARARRGDQNEIRKILAGVKTDDERVAVLIEFAAALVAKSDRETAKELLEEALQTIPAALKRQTDLEMSAKVAAVYSAVAPEPAFLMVEGGIAQMNGIIGAGIRLGEFYRFDSSEIDELDFDSMSKQALLNAPQSAALLKNLAAADFERAVRLADKFERPEVRLFVRLRIVQSLLDAEASEKEKKAREQLEYEADEH